MTKQNNKESKNTLPWLVPGINRPGFFFPRIRLSIKLSVPQYVWLILINFIIFYVYMGGVYNTVTGNVPAYGYNKDGEITIILWNHESVNEQYMIEGLVAGLMMYLGFLGLYLHRSAIQDPHNVRKAENYQQLGIVLITIAVIVLQGMMAYKTQKERP